MLMHALRNKLLAGTQLACAQFDTIRLRLLKCAARVEVSTRRILFHLPLHFPFKGICRRISNLFAALRTQLTPSVSAAPKIAGVRRSLPIFRIFTLSH